jgi:hypothetical protein
MNARSVSLSAAKAGTDSYHRAVMLSIGRADNPTEPASQEQTTRVDIDMMISLSYRSEKDGIHTRSSKPTTMTERKEPVILRLETRHGAWLATWLSQES